MADHDKKALKNGHCDPLRSAYALSDAADREARFSLRSSQKEKAFGFAKIDAKCSQWTQRATNMKVGK